MLCKSLTLLVTAAFAAAAPPCKHDDASASASASASSSVIASQTDITAPSPTPSASVSIIATASASASPSTTGTPTLPVTGGASELPLPDLDLQLLHIGLGYGIQNYSCSAADPAATGTATGALAVLWDVTTLFPGLSPDGLPLDDFYALTATVLNTQAYPLNHLTSNAARRARRSASSHAKFGADAADPFPAAVDLALAGTAAAPFLGHHYFDQAGVPTFDLAGAGILLKGQVLNKVAAPGSADAGPLGTGAVPWLQLGEASGAGSSGAKLVYRVDTAGGNSEKCAEAGPGSTPYAALYWFFG